MRFFLKLLILHFMLSIVLLCQPNFTYNIQTYERCTVLLIQNVKEQNQEKEGSEKATSSQKSMMYGTGVFIYDDLWGTKSYYLVTSMHFAVHDSLKLFLNQLEVAEKLKLNTPKNRWNHLAARRIIPLIRGKNGQPLITSEAEYMNISDDKDILWRHDTTGFSDLIVAKINPERFFLRKKAGFTEHMPLKLSQVIDYNRINIGDEIFTMGYPEIAGTFNDIKDSRRNFQNYASDYEAVFRSGHVSAKPKEIVCTFQKENVLGRKALINELFIYPGQSGSPVFLKKGNRILLMGIASAYFHYKNEINNSGLSLAWPAQIISTIIKENKEYFMNLAM